MAAEGLGLFQNAPTPDWKGGWLKIASMQFLTMSFLRKLTWFLC